MTTKPRRAWFQLHLSTAIVMMFVAGGLIALNLNPQKVQKFDRKSDRDVSFEIVGEIGWPVSGLKIQLAREMVKGGSGNLAYAEEAFANTKIPGLHAFFNDSIALSRQYDALGIGCNMAVLLITLVIVALALESFRREARAP